MRKVTRGKEKGKYNQRELDVIVEEVLNNPDLAADSSKIGFVTPYRKQADTAGRQLPKGIESDTVHKYQGLSLIHILFIFSTSTGTLPSA